MSQLNFKNDQIKKISLSSMGFVFLLYVYFSFFLGPLNRSRNSMFDAMKDKQAKLDSSKGEMAKAATLEHQAKAATTRFAALKSLNSEGAPIAWFPPRIKVFFANEQIDKVVARLENNTAFKDPELAAWMKYNWMLELPQAEYTTFGKAIADLENAEPLLSITKLTIHASPDHPQTQQIDLMVSNIIQKK
jgi:hypothetical protein